MSYNVTDYNTGIAVLKTLHGYMKTNFKFEQLMDGLSRDWDGSKIPDEDLKEWVSSKGATKRMYSGISWKSSSDFNNLLKTIASKVPAGKLPTRKMIDSAFLDPKNFKPSLLDYAKLSVSASGQAIKGASKTVLGTAEFIGNTKYFLLAGGLMYLLYKLLGQSDKISSGYKAVTRDIGSAYGRLSQDAGKAYARIKQK